MRKPEDSCPPVFDVYGDMIVANEPGVMLDASLDNTTQELLGAPNF